MSTVAYNVHLCTIRDFQRRFTTKKRASRPSESCRRCGGGSSRWPGQWQRMPFHFLINITLAFLFVMVGVPPTREYRSLFGTDYLFACGIQSFKEKKL
jgi:hypothetical protein